MEFDINKRGDPSGLNSVEVGAEFIRLPQPPKRCPLTGLTRASLNKLILGDHPKVRSVVVKQPGTARGIRLIHRVSLLEFIYAEMARQEEEREKGAERSD